MRGWSYDYLVQLMVPESLRQLLDRVIQTIEEPLLLEVTQPVCCVIYPRKGLTVSWLLWQSHRNIVYIITYIHYYIITYVRDIITKFISTYTSKT